jgi:hypothetical protein
MSTSFLDPRLWPRLHPLLIAHDVGGSPDRSTAVVGGYSGYAPGILGIKEFNELPQGLYGSERASALAEIDARYDRNALIVADLSNDTSYAEQLLEPFGPRVIGVHIGRHGGGGWPPRRGALGSNWSRLSRRCQRAGWSTPVCQGTMMISHFLRHAELGGPPPGSERLDGRHVSGTPAAPPPATKNQLGGLDVTGPPV